MLQKEIDTIAKLEKKIGYIFQNKSYLLEALTHSSYANERKVNKLPCNERLEFLGDAVLQIVSSEKLYHLFPGASEGQLSKTRSSLVCEPALAENARTIGLEQLVFLGKGEELGGGRKKNSVISDAFEALIGAIFLDGGMGKAKDFILSFALKDPKKHLNENDTKSALQQYYQKNGDSAVIVYKILEESGPEHDKCFKVEVSVNGVSVGVGTGHNKKAAEKMAAGDALERLKK